MHLLITNRVTPPLFLFSRAGSEPTGTGPRNTCTTVPLGSPASLLVLLVVVMVVMTPVLNGLVLYLLQADYLASGRAPLLLLRVMVMALVTLWESMFILTVHLLVLMR